MFRSTPAAFGLRVVSYNVLSSHLASPSHFTTLDPNHLEASYRLPRVLEKIDDEIKQHPHSVVCLQEVSYDWAAQFHTWFANRGYHLVTGLYGKKFNGYMGVALAYSTEHFETLDMDISRLSDKREGGWPKPPETSSSTLTSLWTGVKKFATFPLDKMGLIQKAPEDHWSISQRRFNVLLTATLKDKTTGSSFLISNYHMPCCYYAPMVMSIHCEMAARHVQQLAAAQKLPYVLTGDWNITPESSTYQLMTTGKLDQTDPTYPTPKYDMEWTSNIEPMRSAYKVMAGAEPDFTNNARVGEQEPFINTLDYVFISPEWKVVNCKSIANRKDANGPFPNAVDPSDHVLIAASLELDNTAGT